MDFSFRQGQIVNTGVISGLIGIGLGLITEADTGHGPARSRGTWSFGSGVRNQRRRFSFSFPFASFIPGVLVVSKPSSTMYALTLQSAKTLQSNHGISMILLLPVGRVPWLEASAPPQPYPWHLVWYVLTPHDTSHVAVLVLDALICGTNQLMSVSCHHRERSYICRKKRTQRTTYQDPAATSRHDRFPRSNTPESSPPRRRDSDCTPS